MTNTDRLAAEIVRRRLVIPFEHGSGATGVLIGDWSPRKSYSGLQPTILRQGTLYCVRNGKPFARDLPPVPCPHPASLDVAALYERAVSQPVRRAAVRGNPGMEAEAAKDPFEQLAWGVGFKPGYFHHIHTEAIKATHSDWDTLDAARNLSSVLVTETLRRVDGHFVERLDTRSAEVMRFMRGALPFFSWGAFDALAGDETGGTRAFAEAYPLLAGRTLSDPGVAEAARRGDLTAAYEASLVPHLVGRWTCRTLATHPLLARIVDGRLRGHPVDHAVDLAVSLDRNHVPRGPEEFVDYAETCLWAEAVRDSVRFESANELVVGAKGLWDRTLSACRSASIHDGRELDLPAVRWGIMDLVQQFDRDFIDPAARISSGGVPMPARLGEAGSAMAYSAARDRIALKGMSLADRIRHAVRYIEAKPAIAGADLRLSGGWTSVNFMTEEVPWLSVDESLDILPVFLGSQWSGHKWFGTRGASERRCLSLVYLPASTPDGVVLAICLRRGSDAPVFRGRFPKLDPEQVRLRLSPALACHYGLEGADGLGDAMLTRHGAHPRLSEMGRAAVASAGDRMLALQAAWGPALPRRFRRLDQAALVTAIACELHASMAYREPGGVEGA